MIIKTIKSNPSGDVWNATGFIEHQEELDKHSFVKCAVSELDRVISCFRRTPCYSNFEVQQKFIRKILGIIVYRKDFLLELTKLPASLIEEAEFIEQMRIIENGYKLQSVPVSPSLPSVNEPQEANIVLEYMRNNIEQNALLTQILN